MVTVGALVALVLVATPPWHGIAFARFGDQPRPRDAAPRGHARPLPSGLARDSAHSGLYLYAVTRTRVPMINGYSRSCRDGTSTTFSILSRR